MDVSIQPDILNLPMSRQREHNLTFLFISHDLSVGAHVGDVVAVLYPGGLVEMAPTRALFLGQRHPYSTALLSAISSLDPDREDKVVALEGEIPSPLSPALSASIPGAPSHVIVVGWRSQNGDRSLTLVMLLVTMLMN